MNLSGILVMARPEHLPGVVAELGALPGVEVHQQDPAGRLVVVLEADSVRAETDDPTNEPPPEPAALPGLNACRY